ncbi:MAG: MmgE/PrpD family protein [Desulfobacterales bacterium]|jgi:2-methylcitrate dehydratase PrpD|nr:MmgE/PrpD family protein [Desulfobacterales bacterium]
MEQPITPVPLRRELAHFIHDLSFASLPDTVIHHAKRCLLDLIGVGIAGSRQRAAVMVRRLLPAMGGGEEATLWGSDAKVSVLTAVFMNAVQGHAIDMDDGHRYANGHPGVVVIPAAVALAEKADLTGRELISAIAAGYEFFIRLGSAVNPNLLLRGFHTTATIGCFSSGAVAATLLDLSLPQIENALSLSGLQSAGLLEVLHSGESGKSFQVGKAAQSGVLAALLAQQGADGPEGVFEGEKGFFKAFAATPCDRYAICRGLGEHYHLPGVYIKAHAACRHIHSALDAVAELAADPSLSLEKIDSIDIETYSIAKSLTGHMATAESELGAKFSTPIAVGLLLVFGRSDASVYRTQFVSDPRVQSIAKRVSVHARPERDEVYPEKRGAQVTIRTDTHAYTREVTYSKGEPENPISDEELAEKFEKNASALYAADRIGRMRDIIFDIENRNVRELTALLGKPDRP